MERVCLQSEPRRYAASATNNPKSGAAVGIYHLPKPQLIAGKRLSPEVICAAVGTCLDANAEHSAFMANPDLG